MSKEPEKVTVHKPNLWNVVWQSLYFPWFCFVDLEHLASGCATTSYIASYVILGLWHFVLYHHVWCNCTNIISSIFLQLTLFIIGYGTQLIIAHKLTKTSFKDSSGKLDIKLSS